MMSKLIPRSAVACSLALACAWGVACRSPQNPPKHDRVEPPLPSATPSAMPAPSTSTLALLATAEAPAASVEPRHVETLPPRTRSVLVIGDSLSDPRVGGGGYLRAIERGCPDVVIDNRAKGGFMVNQMRRRFEAQLQSGELGRFTDVIVFGGVNDIYSDLSAGRTFEKISADLAFMYRAAKAAKLRVTAVTVAPWGGFSRYYNPTRAETTRRINAWIAEQRATGLVDVVIDAYGLLSCGDPERLCPDYEPPFKDGLHFGAKGHARLGAALVEQGFPECRSGLDADPR